MKNEMTINEGLEVQANDMKRWKALLKPETYSKLELEMLAHNGSNYYENGFEVWRGVQIDEFVMNMGYNLTGTN